MDKSNPLLSKKKQLRLSVQFQYFWFYILSVLQKLVQLCQVLKDEIPLFIRAHKEVCDLVVNHHKTQLAGKMRPWFDMFIAVSCVQIDECTESLSESSLKFLEVFLKQLYRLTADVANDMPCDLRLIESLYNLVKALVKCNNMDKKDVCSLAFDILKNFRSNPKLLQVVKSHAESSQAVDLMAAYLIFVELLKTLMASITQKQLALYFENDDNNLFIIIFKLASLLIEKDKDITNDAIGQLSVAVFISSPSKYFIRIERYLCSALLSTKPSTLILALNCWFVIARNPELDSSTCWKYFEFFMAAYNRSPRFSLLRFSLKLLMECFFACASPRNKKIQFLKTLEVNGDFTCYNILYRYCDVKSTKEHIFKNLQRSLDTLHIDPTKKSLNTAVSFIISYASVTQEFIVIRQLKVAASGTATTSPRIA